MEERVEWGISEGSKTSVCPSDEKGFSDCSFPCLGGKNISRPGSEAKCVGLLCFLLQTLLSRNGFDKAAARHTGNLPQKQKSQVAFQSKNSFPRLVTYFKIVNKWPNNNICFSLWQASAPWEMAPLSHSESSFQNVASWPGSTQLLSLWILAQFHWSMKAG